MKGIEAYRMMDTVVAQNLVMTTTCKYADIVLPVTSPWERYGDVTKGMRESLLWFSQVVDPLFECKSDAEIAAELADRIGVDRQVLQPKTEKQMVIDLVAAAQVIKEDGTDFENLVKYYLKTIWRPWGWKVLLKKDAFPFSISSARAFTPLNVRREISLYKRRAQVIPG